MRILLTNSARFNPYTFDEMLKPLTMAADAYNSVLSGIEELGTKADLIKRYANEVPDSRTANMYNSYAKELENLANILSKYGLTPASRQGLLNMKRRYSSEITPIERNIANREALTKELREARLRDPSIMFDVDYSMTPLDYFLDNPSPTYSSLSGNELTKRASLMATNLAKTIQNNPKYKSILGGQYYQQMQQMGYTPNQIMLTILNDGNAPKELRQIVETITNEAGLFKYSSDILEKARNYINAGLYEGIGTTKYDNISNRGYMIEDERAYKELALKQKDELINGILLPNGHRLKTVGAGKVIDIDPDSGTYTPVTFSSDKTNTLTKLINEAAKVSDVPIVIANTNGKWRSGKVGDNVKGTSMGMTRSNMVSTWGYYTLDNISNGTIATIDELPLEVAQSIKEAIKENNLNINNYTIVKVKASGKRNVAGDYDFALIPNNSDLLPNIASRVENSQDTGNNDKFKAFED